MDYFWLLISPKGRINRAKYLVVQLTLLAVWCAVLLKSPLDLSTQWQAWVVIAAMSWINIATTAKRLHDRNRSGWWTVAIIITGRLSYLYYGLFFGLYFGVDLSISKEMLLVLSAVALSLLQTWIIIELFFMIGTDGPNRYGSDPLARVTTGAPVVAHLDQRSVPDFLVHRAGQPG